MHYLKVTFKLPCEDKEKAERFAELLNGWRYCKDELLIKIESMIEDNDTCACDYFDKAEYVQE